jgi:hypothetical protein
MNDIDDKALSEEPSPHGLGETLLILDDQNAHRAPSPTRPLRNSHSDLASAPAGCGVQLMLGGPDSSPQSLHSLSRSVSNLDGRVGATKGGSAMLKPTDLDLRRQEIRPGHWGSGSRSVSLGSSALSSSRCF